MPCTIFICHLRFLQYSIFLFPVFILVLTRTLTLMQEMAHVLTYPFPFLKWEKQVSDPTTEHKIKYNKNVTVGNISHANPMICVAKKKNSWVVIQGLINPWLERTLLGKLVVGKHYVMSEFNLGSHSDYT